MITTATNVTQHPAPPPNPLPPLAPSPGLCHACGQPLPPWVPPAPQPKRCPTCKSDYIPCPTPEQIRSIAAVARQTWLPERLRHNEQLGIDAQFELPRVSHVTDHMWRPHANSTT